MSDEKKLIKLVVGNNYKWVHQSEKLIYVGKAGAWNRFALIENPNVVWCELLDADLHMIENWNKRVEP